MSLTDEHRAGLDITEQLAPGPGGAPDVRVLVYRPKGSSGPLPLVLSIHGGAFVLLRADTFAGMDAGWALRHNCVVASVDYRLAPEHPFPAAIDDSVASYRWLLERLPSESIAIAGDSAGGGLVLATLIRARDEGLPLPACAVAISPWTDLELTGSSVESLQPLDPMLDAGRLKESAGLYLNGTDARAPLASPIYADLHGLPPLLIHAGTNEILVDDATRLEERARAAGVDVTLDVVPEMVHVWHIFAGAAPESDEAVAKVGAFVRRYVAHQ
jgi:acetyl esterase/lipase